MKNLLLLLLLVSIAAALLLSCGSDSHSPTPPAQTKFLAFLQEKPNYPGLFYAMMGSFSSGRFSSSIVQDPSTHQKISAAFGSMILSGNGSKAVFDLYGGTTAVPTNQWDIFIANPDGTGLTQITNDADEDSTPQLNSTATKVVYSSYRFDGTASHLLTLIRNVDGSGEQVLPLPPGASGSWHPSFSPDGSKIAVEAFGENAGVHFDGIFLMNADGSSPTMLTNPTNDTYVVDDETPFFTSDGTRIVFSRWDSSTATEDVYIMKSDGTAVSRLTRRRRHELRSRRPARHANQHRPHPVQLEPRSPRRRPQRLRALHHEPRRHRTHAPHQQYAVRRLPWTLGLGLRRRPRHHVRPASSRPRPGHSA